MKGMQYTIRQVPPKLDEKLRRLAAATGLSLNEAAVRALAKGLGVTNEPVLHHDLDEFSGTWVEDPAFDAAVEAFEAIDEGAWK